MANALDRHQLACLILLFAVTVGYVFIFITFGRFMIPQFLAPIAIITLLIIWALPHREPPPEKSITYLFFGFAGSSLIWPDYLAFSFPGLPWITAMRITGFPMAFLLLTALSSSPAFRKKLYEIHSKSRFVMLCVLSLMIYIFASIVFSTHILLTVNKAVVASVYLISIFFVSAFIFRIPGRAQNFIYLLWAASLFVCLIGLWEARLGHVPWYGHIPSFLKIEDESVQRMLSPNARAATGIIRVQSKFRNPLGFAEFLGLVTPFIVHFIMTHRFVVVKLLAIVTMPLFFLLVIKTDSRLGSAAFMMSIVLYVGAWGLVRWTGNKNSIFGPAITIGYPIFFAAFIAATFFVRRLETMVWGGGAQAASNLARQIQWDMGIPKILSRPWGHGWGASAESLGFRTGDTLTLDSYVLSLLLEIGPIGCAIFFAPLIFVGLMTVKHLHVLVRDSELGLLIPICIAFLNFIIVKVVLSEQENHPLVFMMLGLAVALLYRMPRKMPTEITPNGTLGQRPQHRQQR